MRKPLIVLIAKRSSWANLVEQARDPLVLDLLKKNDPSVGRMKAAHEAHEACLRAVEAALSRLPVEIRPVDDPRKPFSCEGASLVLSVGGDGTLLSASHHVAGVPVLGVNSAPGFSVGFFCGADAASAASLLPLAIEGKLEGVTLTRMEVLCNNEVFSSRVLNEALICNSCPAATSRYLIESSGASEEHRSSGVFCGPAAGSTAALRSAGGEVLPLDSAFLQFVVREPYIPEEGPYQLTRGLLGEGQSLRLKSKMRDAAVYIDGADTCFRVTLGDLVECRRSPEPLRLLGISADRRRARDARKNTLPSGPWPLASPSAPRCSPSPWPSPTAAARRATRPATMETRRAALQARAAPARPARAAPRARGKGAGSISPRGARAAGAGPEGSPRWGAARW